ncbi:MAG: decaprenyl-phosphate phosphoribosyltransferase [Kiritimatiellae bacterium]|nr:decaprenyl-phosphate phosphoribosyltransferase [Kiritimatiellia bacterium]
MSAWTSRSMDVLRAMRPGQWTKNAVVAAAFFFAIGDKAQSLDLFSATIQTILAVVAFCLVSSGVYVFNDIRDRDADRRHPEKRFRPIAAGRMPVRDAVVLSCCLLMVGIGLASWLHINMGLIVSSYVGLQALYSLVLKRVALLDILVIAMGFVIRALAGGLALNVPVSPWLLMCTFLLALFLGVCKRRHEKVQVGDEEQVQREALEKYDTRLLDQLVAITSSSTVLSYAIYTLSPETIEKFGTSALGLTIPFVVFGVFRYLDLVYRQQLGDRPEKILLTDVPILINLAAYGITLLIIFACAV